MNNAITEIKNTLEGISNRITEAEDRISDMEDRMVERNEAERKKKSFPMTDVNTQSGLLTEQRTERIPKET